MADFEVHIDLGGRTRCSGLARSNQVQGSETILFEYDDVWLEDADRFSLEPALAPMRGAFAPPAGLATFGSIGDSAPDTWGRRDSCQLSVDPSDCHAASPTRRCARWRVGNGGNWRFAAWQPALSDQA